MHKCRCLTRQILPPKFSSFLEPCTEKGGRGGVAIYSRWIYDFLGRLFCVVGIMCATIHTHKHINSSILPKQPYTNLPLTGKKERWLFREIHFYGVSVACIHIFCHTTPPPPPIYWNFWGGNFSPGGSNREPWGGKVSGAVVERTRDAPEGGKYSSPPPPKRNTLGHEAVGTNHPISTSWFLSENLNFQMEGYWGWRPSLKGKFSDPFI